MDIKGSQTEKNLLTSFAGESQARNRYTYSAKIAKKEGFVQVANAFEETANHEKEHAKRFFKFLQEAGDWHGVEIGYEFPTGPLSNTVENLRAAADGEHHEFTTMYPGFADIADEEGFTKIATAWRNIAKAETWHHERFTALADNIEKDRVFARDEDTEWICQNCGYRHTGKYPPEKCPACDHPKAHFMIHSAKF
ncbi:rubrerythrin family protein [Candidatus Thorarchaeota archaeon]|nr:MAG: rubrerythrin family protein [Candidatus Thorarchaeota archaeon]